MPESTRGPAATEAGLESLAESAPLPVVVRGTPDERFPEPVERAAYLVVAGSIDAGLDAGANKISIRVARTGDHLVIEAEGAGTGPFADLADRVGAMADVRRPTGASCGRKSRARSRRRRRHAHPEEIMRLLGGAGIEVAGEAEDASGLMRLVAGLPHRAAGVTPGAGSAGQRGGDGGAARAPCPAKARAGVAA